MADSKPIEDEDSDSMDDDEVVVIDKGNAGGKYKDQMLKQIMQNVEDKIKHENDEKKRNRREKWR